MTVPQPGSVDDAGTSETGSTWNESMPNVPWTDTSSVEMTLAGEVKPLENRKGQSLVAGRSGLADVFRDGVVMAGTFSRDTS